MIGPNCLGLMNAHPSVQLNATFAPSAPHFGCVAFASQSGALGLAVLDEAEQLGLGISQFVSLGNKADVSGNDLLELWEDDPSTRVVLLYMESLGNPRRFMDVARRVSRKKPIVVVKSGRTAAGHRAASSHTGSRATLDVATDALLGQAGIIRTDTIHELFDVATLLAHQPVPAGNRVAIVTNAGGPGIMAADACESRGLLVAPLEEQTQGALKELLPHAAAVVEPGRSHRERLGEPLRQGAAAGARRPHRRRGAGALRHPHRHRPQGGGGGHPRGERAEEEAAAHLRDGPARRAGGDRALARPPHPRLRLPRGGGRRAGQGRRLRQLPRRPRGTAGRAGALRSPTACRSWCAEASATASRTGCPTRTWWRSWRPRAFRA